MLYNGISLPDVWPPQPVDDESLEPLPIPYLAQPPTVIKTDIGRQLFIDDFLIESTTLTRRFGKPVMHPASPVLQPETDEEMDNGNCPMAAPFNDGVWYDPHDELYKMWYMPGWFHSVALATSKDGIRWERPVFDVVPGTNLVWPCKPGYDRDGCVVWLDHEAENPRERFKMLQFYRYPGFDWSGWLHASPDGIHWSEPVKTNPFGDNTSIFYNPFRRKWCYSIRRVRKDGYRIRAYREANDLLCDATWDEKTEESFWQRTDRIDLPDPSRPDHRVALYDVNAVAYESLMIGIFGIFRGPENNICAEEGVPKLIDLELGFSRDGFHYSRPNRTPFLASTRQAGDWNRAYLHAAGGICLVVGDELRFYFTGFSGESPKLGPNDAGSPGHSRLLMYAGASTGFATLRRDGFASMEAGPEAGYLQTRPLSFQGNRLFVNVDVPDGELRVAALDADAVPIAGFSAEDCLPVNVNSTRVEVAWRSGKGLSVLAGQPLCLRFELTNGQLFSFWVTDDPGGASYGYMAAGGPGFTQGRDLPKSTRPRDRMEAE